MNNIQVNYHLTKVSNQVKLLSDIPQAWLLLQQQQ